MPKVDDGYKVQELFVEALVPIVQDAKMFRDLSLELGYRYSDYSTSGGFNTYKGLLNWALHRLDPDPRRLQPRGARAERVGPLPAAALQPRRPGRHLCGTRTRRRPSKSAAEPGMTQSSTAPMLTQTPPASTTPSSVATRRSPPRPPTPSPAGMVWTPQSITGLSVTLDYYNISITEAIGASGAGGHHPAVRRDR